MELTFTAAEYRNPEAVAIDRDAYETAAVVTENVSVPVPELVAAAPFCTQPVPMPEPAKAEFATRLWSAYCTNPLLLMTVAVLDRLKVKRLSSPLMLVKSSESVEPSPPANMPGRRIRRGTKSGRVRMSQIVYQKAPIEPPLALP